MKTLKTVAALGVASALLTACGGSHDDKAKAPDISATNGVTASQSPSQSSTASPTGSGTSSTTAGSTPSASETSKSASDSKGTAVPAPGQSSSSKGSSAPSHSSSSPKASQSKSASPSKSSSASPTAKPITKDDMGGSDCTILPATSTKSPSFTLKGTKANVTKDNSDVTFTFSKDFNEKLFSDEASKTKAKEYGFRLVNASGDNLIYSFKSHKAFKMATTGKDAGKQQELPSVKVSIDGKKLKVTMPQKDFSFTKKAWGAEEFFYVDTNNIFLSSCEKRNS